MHLNFGPNGILQFDDVRIIFRNFEGRGDKYNREGDRNFAILIETEEIKEHLLNDVNKYGVPWNVKVKPPREEGDEPFMYLPVKLKFNGRGPNIYLSSGRSRTVLDESSSVISPLAPYRWRCRSYLLSLENLSRTSRIA